MYTNVCGAWCSPWPGRVNVPRVKPRVFRWWSIDLQSLHWRLTTNEHDVEWPMKKKNGRHARCDLTGRPADWNLLARRRHSRRQCRWTKTLNPILFYLRYEISFRDGSRIVPFIVYLGRLRESARLRNGGQPSILWRPAPRVSHSSLLVLFLTVFLLHVSSFSSFSISSRSLLTSLFHLSPSPSETRRLTTTSGHALDVNSTWDERVQR